MTRLIIANDLDDWIVRKKDVRAWAQRMLWFAEPGDVVVAMAPPDAAFLAHVAGVKGFDPGELTVHVIPAGRFEGMVDHLALDTDEFAALVRPYAASATEVLAAWPSPHVASFVERLGIADRWPGHALFAQGACEPLNSMGGFRAWAAAAGAPISRGSVCRSKDDAVRASADLLASTRAIVVKKAHGGAGAGNHIVTTSAEVELERAGGKYVTVLDGSAASVASFWDEHWEWASAGGAYPVVVEEFQAGARSIYAEFDCSAEGARLCAIGELSFGHRQLERETVPAQGVAELARERLIAGARRLADYYWALGYRGPLSADAVVSPSDEVVFTEVNAQYTGSTHLYRVLGALAGDDRVVTQVTTPPFWPIASTEGFLAGVAASGCSFDPVERRGIVAVTPRIGAESLGPLVLAVIHAPEEDVGTTLARLDPALAAVTAR
jgi:hypothetical protein